MQKVEKVQAKEWQLEIPEWVYFLLIRLFALGIGALLWRQGIRFSENGFDFVAGYREVGTILALTVTCLQLLFIHGGGKDPTIRQLGIIAYAYDIATNIIGILTARGGIPKTLDPTTAATWAIAIFGGSLLAIAAERLIWVGLTGLPGKERP